MPRILAAALLAGGLALPTLPAHATPQILLGSSGNVRFAAPRAEHAPSVDGRIDSAEWEQAAVLDSFTQRQPVEGVRDTLGTQCLVMYDAEGLYVAFRCRELPGKVQAPIVGRDNVFSGDWVAVSIDAYHDRRRSYVFIANPRGIQADGVDQEGSDTDLAPDFQFGSAGRVTPEGYEVEMVIPFRSLRFPNASPVTFGFNAIRRVQREGSQMFWSPITRNIANFHQQFGDLQKLEGVRPGRNVQINPYVTGSKFGTRAGNKFEWDAAESRQGGDLKIGLTSALTADVTLTPDFSQVEADAGVVDVNERFAIFFAEKRSFFLEGSDIFTTPLNLVYTRRVADPLYGVKLTGKAGKTSIGVLNAMDRSAAEPIETLPDAANPYFDRNAVYSIARFKQDVLANSTLGVLIGERRQQDQYNRGAGLDGRFTFHKNYSLTFQGVKSWARDRDMRGAISELDSATTVNLDPALLAQTGRETEGYAYAGSIGRDTKNSSASLSFTDIARDFTADMGFINRTNLIELNQWYNPRWFSKGGWYRRIDVYLSSYQQWEHGAESHFGRLTDAQFRPEVEISFAKNTWAGGGFNRLYTYFNGREFDPRVRVFAYTGSERFQAVRAGIFSSYGDEVLFGETAPGKSVAPEFWSDFRFSKQLDASFNLNGVRLRRVTPSSKYADVVIPRVRVSYQHSRELAVRAIGEWRDARRFDTSNQLTSINRSLSLDLLFSYLLRPGTVVYLGYGSRLDAQGDAAMRVANNSLFLKASYLWQM